jgi:HrpA-like RNA helicase
MPVPTLYRKGFLLDDKDVIPVEFIMRWFLDKLGKPGIKNRVLILKSTTGSGKSTVLPPEFYEQVNSGKIVCCTQPRILNAISIPKQIIPYFANASIPLELGKNVGFQTGFISQKIKNSGIVYMTIGVLYMHLTLLDDESLMKRYSCIFIDEAHERSVLLDCVMYLLKEFLTRNIATTSCPFVVIMSATIDTEIYDAYFGVKNSFHVEGETYPITKNFLVTESRNLIKTIIDTVIEYHKNDKEPGKYRDILVFVPGIGEINKLKTALYAEYKKDPELYKRPILPIEVTSDSVKRNPYEIFAEIETLRMKMGDKVYKPVRRVFFGTNVTETGITISSLSTVIETGFYNSSEFYPLVESQSLMKKPVTQSMMLQRCGRVGREAPGTAYILYTEDVYKKLDPIQQPDIIKESVTDFLLSLAIQQIKKFPTLIDTITNYIDNNTKAKVDINNINLLTQPSSDNIHFSMNKLYYYGAIDLDCNVTPLGIIFNRISSVPIEIARMILFGFLYDVAIIDLINIAAALPYTVDVVTKFPLIYTDDFINGLYYFDAIKDYMDTIPVEMIMHREDICYGLTLAGFNPYHNLSKRFSSLKYANQMQYIQQIKKCIYQGFKLNTCIKRNNTYYNRLGNKVIVSHGYELNYSSNSPENNPLYVLYDGLLLRNIKGEPQYTTSKLCVLDGFVNIDVHFDSPF